nr:finP protein - Escherichia coli plasmid pSU233 [Escherichia coli]
THRNLLKGFYDSRCREGQAPCIGDF